MSIAALFTGGLLPGAVLGLALCAVVWWRSRQDTRPLPPRAGRREIGRSFVIALPALALPFVIRSSVIEGVATATEVSTIGIVYSLIVGLLVYRQFDWSRIAPDAGADRIAVGRDPDRSSAPRPRWPGRSRSRASRRTSRTRSRRSRADACRSS